MKNKIQLLTFFSFVFIICSISNAQNKAAEGMEATETNYSSFTERPIQDLGNWKKINKEAFYSHPEFGILPLDAPCKDCSEDLSKRTVDERFFVDNNDQKQFYQQKAMGELHELIGGNWITIDHRLKKVSNGIYKSGFNMDRAGFDLENKISLLETTHGDLSFNNWKLILKKDGQFQSPISANWSNISIGDDGVKITAVFPGIDAEMRVLRGAIKTNFIIKTNEFGVFDEMIFTDQFESNGEIELSFSNSLSKEGIGNVLVKNDQGELALIQQGVLYAKNGPKELALEPVYRISLNNLGVVVPYNWINENINAYELVVDPLVTGSSTLVQAAILGSRYNASCNFTNSCNYNLTVARPANATITNVTWSFSYVAIGPLCWLNDGAVRFSTTTGGCLSPSAAGFYWFCNNAYSGNCNGNNISVFNDLGSCIPAPSCVPADVTFTMQFFRSCWGTSGCSNTCIGAASPWTMTITGRTMEYANAASNITLSATTVCQGGTITASTSALYGVPAYSYNWSFSPTGAPSVGSGASANIVFPTSGNITLYSFVTDACGNLVTSSRVITVNAPVTPTFATFGPYCQCAAPGILPTTSTNGITGTWSPSAISTATAGTVVYTFTPTAGLCAVPITLSIVTNPIVVSMPANGGTSVACPVNANTAPNPPVVTDNCGRTLTVSAPAVSATPACSGIKTYTYTYTNACGTTYPWVYTYTISAPTVTMPPNAGTTVACPTAAV
ncbi:MAG: hypothetical protein NWS40_00830, partial [Crocinitomicaceae bacterium]|nr:hypothetical protein [Crocinitomicaceae bacterium]